MAADHQPPVVAQTKDVTKMAADFLIPLGGQLTLGSTLGWCAGMALRTFGRVAAVGVGGTFCIVQALAYKGFIEVDWRKVEKQYLRLMDKDQDGAIGVHDVTHVWNRAQDVLAFNLPAGAGFTAGLVYGLGGTAGVSWKAALLTGVGGRLLVARGAVGGLGAFGSPAAVVSLQEYIDDEAESNVVIRTVRPGYCMPHILGESEERCVWSSDVFSTARYRAIAAR
eukprot:TRINITY_DN27703_c0_g1_i2.p1 TRINITY_DN27703_c0_g1~~TRINITY_DN27703_c0_g1_i2.p1  ORF type:complete len:244 (+),score=36.78 TRINITY_DN27703_c0_g1_i2:61-732(+)